jgi:hypothetical protein
MVFGIVCLVVLVPLSTLATALFHRRRDVQPIKGRLPPLVIVQDIVLVGLRAPLAAAHACLRIRICDDSLWMRGALSGRRRRRAEGRIGQVSRQVCGLTLCAVVGRTAAQILYIAAVSLRHIIGNDWPCTISLW